MKVLVLNGSPRQQSDTMRVTNAFLDGIKKSGDHEIEVVDIIKHRLSPCMGCYGCWKNLDGRCVIDDYQNVILDKMRAADAVIWSFPLYCCGMPSHVKAVLDRMLPVSKMRIVGSGELKPGAELDFSKKRFVVICGSGFPVGVANFEALKVQCIHMFGRVRIICVPQTPLFGLKSAAAAAVTERRLERFVAAGEEFGNRTYLYRETVAGLEEPLVTNEEYMQMAREN